MFNFLLLKDISEHPLWKEQIQRRLALKEINIKVWLETNLFSPVWWLMVITFILLWFIWWKLVDKSRLLEIVTYGLLVSVMTSIVDIFATLNVIWGFPIRLFPLTPPIFFENLCILPIIYMLLYQFFDSWKFFSLALFVISLVLAFVFEPIAVWLDIFQMNNWKSTYSFPVYLLLGFFTKWVIYKIKTIQVNFLV